MKRANLLAVLVGVVAVGVFPADASAVYHPGMGVFMTRDPGVGAANRIGAGGAAPVAQFIPRDPYADGPNLYQYVRGNPVTRLDPMGLWGADIHRDKSTEWAKANDVGMVQWAAERVGLACNGVDPPEWKWPFHTTKTNLEWHFDIPVTKPNAWGSGDSRYAHSIVEFTNARFLCLEWRHPTDKDVVAALDSLGKSLHPLEDWVAHGVWDPTYHWYNAPNWRAHPTGTDDFGKDDNRSVDGRLQDDLKSADDQKQYLVLGTKRATLTEKMAKERLLAFKNGLTKGGKCWCKIFKWK